MSMEITEEPVAATLSALDLAYLPKSDLGNARRLVARFGDALAFVPRQGWRAWNGKFWETEDQGEAGAKIAAHTTADMIAEEADALQEAGKYEDELPEDFARRVAHHRKFGTDSGNAGRTRAMLEQATNLLQREFDQWDEDPLLINCDNGTLKFIEVGGDWEVRLFKHNRADYCTRTTGQVYDPMDPPRTPVWDAHLLRCLPEGEKRQFFQTYSGYAATGNVSEQTLLFMQGKGSDGKSTTINALVNALGGYAMSAAITSFLQNDYRGGGDASPDIARLAGASRFVPVSEPKKGDRLDEAGIKSMTGGDRMTARKLHKDIFEFYPVFKMIVPCNHLPIITSSDDGTWRRILLLIWTQQIGRAHWDRHINEKLRAEASGILHWVVEGVLEYLSAGEVEIPSCVEAAVQNWRGDVDPAGVWLAERFDLDPKKKMLMGEIYADYEAWCQQAGLDPMSKKWLSKQLTAEQIHTQRVAGMSWKVGLALKEDAPTLGKAADDPDDAGPFGDMPPASAYEGDG